MNFKTVKAGKLLGGGFRSVNGKTPEFQQLKDSIECFGILKPLTVRASDYTIIDGNARHQIALQLSIKVPVCLIACDDIEALQLAIILNQRPLEVKPIEFHSAILRLIAMDPSRTFNQMVQALHCHPFWLNERLRFHLLTPSIMREVDYGFIRLANAHALTKLPHEEQEEFALRAKLMPFVEFIAAVHAKVKELKDAAKRRRKADVPN